MEQWLVSTIMEIYDGALAVLRTLDVDTDSFEVKVGLHQGSVHTALSIAVYNSNGLGNFYMPMIWF